MVDVEFQNLSIDYQICPFPRQRVTILSSSTWPPFMRLAILHTFRWRDIFFMWRVGWGGGGGGGGRCGRGRVYNISSKIERVVTGEP